MTVFFLNVLWISKLLLFLKTRYFSSAFSFLKCILEAGELSHQVKAFYSPRRGPKFAPSIYVGWLSTTFNSNSRGFNALFWPLKATHMYKPTHRHKYTKLKMKYLVCIQWMKYDPSISLMPAHSPIILLNHSPVADHSRITEYETAFCRHNDL